jgi:tetratricopeptide (TPR) repeat protein
MIRVFWLGLLIVGFGSLPLFSQESKPATATFNEAFSKAYAEAIGAFNRNEFEACLAKLEEADKAQPGLRDTNNLRGAVFYRLKRLDEAAVIFKQLLETDPKDPISSFNLGEVYLLQKNFAESKKMYLKYLEAPDNKENALGRYKVFLCDVMLENKSEVQKTLNSLRPTISNPFYYFANAAVLYKTGDTEKGRGYVQSAYSIYPQGLSTLFAESFVGLGWLTQEEVGQIGVVDANALKSLSEGAAPNRPEGPQSFLDTLDAMIPTLDGRSKDQEKRN